jgi:hypothetical protein
VPHDYPCQALHCEARIYITLSITRQVDPNAAHYVDDDFWTRLITCISAADHNHGTEHCVVV